MGDGVALGFEGVVGWLPAPLSPQLNNAPVLFIAGLSVRRLDLGIKLLDSPQQAPASLSGHIFFRATLDCIVKCFYLSHYLTYDGLAFSYQFHLLSEAPASDPALSTDGGMHTPQRLLLRSPCLLVA